MLVRIIFIFLAIISVNVTAEEVTLPLSLDHKLLKQLIIKQLFTGENNSAEIINDPAGCSTVVLTEPEFSEYQKKLQIHLKVDANLGMSLFDYCLPLLDWTGTAQVVSEPVVDQHNPFIHFNIIDSQLINKEDEILSSGQIWDFFKENFHPFFSQFKLDLSSSINELKAFLPLVLPTQSQIQGKKMLDSLRISRLDIDNLGIKAYLTLNVDKISNIKKSEKILTEQERLQWQQKWQSMDAFLTFVIKQYAGATELTELRDTLFEILMDARYLLHKGITENHEQDFIRSWFINSWEQLTPIIREITQNNPEYNTLSLMTLMTATDALQALDQLGPSFGLEISVDGLRRLARLVNKSPGLDPLQYEQVIDPELLKLFMPQQVEPMNLNFNFWPVQSAYALGSDKLNRWVPKPDELHLYLPEIKKLLVTQANKTQKTGNLSPAQKNIFQHTVLATGLQESCWRQYVVEQKKIVPLRSATGDTGIMQINETVWRGFFDVQKLRWDIAYNVKSGAGILLRYLTRYAIKKAEHKKSGGLDNLALSTYSAYNGGPGQYARYRTNKNKVDRAFDKKFKAVKQGQEFKVAECFNKQAVQSKAQSPTKSRLLND